MYWSSFAGSLPPACPSPQKHNAAREVFLTQQRDQVEVASLEKAAHVLPPEDFYRGSDALGDNVFLCEYEYDTVWEVRMCPWCICTWLLEWPAHACGSRAGVPRRVWFLPPACPGGQAGQRRAAYVDCTVSRR